MSNNSMQGASLLSSEGGSILVTGGTGQLATSLMRLGGKRLTLTGRPNFDFDKIETLKKIFEATNPVAVINTAAWTAVDLAESEPDAAARANTRGPAELARLCATRDIPFIHVSTDYVFSGDKGSPYKETDCILPQTVYGRTKAEGEALALAANPKTIIFRTAWVYAQYGKNFVKTMLNAGAKNSILKVVGDQKGNPTSTDDLAQAILKTLHFVEKNEWQEKFSGVYHVCGTGNATWHELAVATLQAAEQYGQKMPQVLAIKTEDWPTPAKRPADSRMDTSKVSRTFGVVMPPWQESVKRVVEQIFNHS